MKIDFFVYKLIIINIMYTMFKTFRDGLRKVNLALHNVVQIFTRYLSNCENELNNTLIGELAKISNGPSPPSEGEEDYLGETLASLQEDGAQPKVHFAPDLTDILNLIGDEESINATNGDNVSVIQTELNTWLQRLKCEAAAILSLTSGKRRDEEEVTTEDAPVQTDEDEYEKCQDTIQVLQNVRLFYYRARGGIRVTLQFLILCVFIQELLNYEKLYAKSQDDINTLNAELTRVKEKLNAAESLEGYGEYMSVVPSSKKSAFGNGGKNL